MENQNNPHQIPSSTPTRLPIREPKPLSCISCRLKKIKCDRFNPCSACLRTSTDCIQPSRQRLPRGREGGRKNTELLNRLRRLEGLVEKYEKPDNARISEATVKQRSSSGKSDEVEIDPIEGDVKISNGDRVAERTEGGVGCYLGAAFWGNLCNEVKGLRHTLSQPSDDEEEEEDSNGYSESVSTLNLQTSHSGFIFGFDPKTSKSLSSCPSSFHIAMLYPVYMANVDPVFKVLHKPTMLRTMLETKDRAGMPKGKGEDALTFAILFAAVTSLTPSECNMSLGEEKSTMVENFRTRTEQALANADFLNSVELVTLQALAIFLFSARCHDNTRFVWTLTSLTVRIATALNLHHDSATSCFSVFDIEMRRRLWWEICVLDARASEDRASEPSIIEGLFDTRMPSNINDEDLEPESLQIVEREGYTEMTFCLISHEVTNLFKRLSHLPLGLDKNRNETKDREIWVTECCQLLESKYLKYCDMSIPLSWVTGTVCRLIMARLWLSIHHPCQRYGVASIPEVTKQRLLLISVEILEYAHLLDSEISAAKFKWLFKTYVQWHALAVVLAELCVQTQGEMVDRAWRIIDIVFEYWSERIADSNKGMLWRPMKKLMGKARLARQVDSLSVEKVVGRPNALRNYAQGPQDMSGIQLTQPYDDEVVPSSFAQISGLPVMEQSTIPLKITQEAQMTADAWMLNGTNSSWNPNEYADQINWADWDGFMKDLQQERIPEDGPISGQPTAEFNMLW